MRKVLLAVGTSLAIVAATATISEPASAQKEQLTICSFEYGDGRIVYAPCLAF